MKYLLVLAGVVIISLMACNPSVKPEQLIGKWNYTKVENPNQQPAYSMPEEEVKKNSPTISFTQNKLIMIWGGKKLSAGTYRMENRMIRYKEKFDDGTSREFPFLIKEISDTSLVFETMEQNATRITAKRLPK